MTHSINVYFDESGKIPKEISLMGGLLIPANIYNGSVKIKAIDDNLKQNKVNFHFTAYKNNDFKKYKDLIDAFMEYDIFTKINIVSYKKINVIKKRINQSIQEKMIYSKIPERVVYGLLRDYGNFTDLKARLFIEDCSQYQKLSLDDLIKEQLNIHSLYRNENYWVDESNLYEKNEKVGIEFIDTVLGMVRMIIENKDGSSNTLSYKHTFIKKMLKNKSKMYEFLCNINYFELNGQANLEKKELKKYIDLFLAKQNF